MVKAAYHGNSIARAVYDQNQEAIRVTDGAVAAGEGAEETKNENIPNTAGGTEIGSNAGSRKVGILIVLQSSNFMYYSIGETTDANHAKLVAENESVFLPTNASVYGLSSDAAGSNISYVEI
jgi:hypothetical protein